MNLFECTIPYTVIPDRLLELKSKINILAAIDLLRYGDTCKTIDKLPIINGYYRRKLKDIRYDLKIENIINESGELTDINTDERVLIPSNCRYEGLTLGSLKTIIVCFKRCRYKRIEEYFRFTATQEELAEQAKITERSLRDALNELVKRDLILVEKRYKKGTKITMLDPWSGVELYFLGERYRHRYEGLTVHERYQAALINAYGQHVDSKGAGALALSREPVTNFPILCPFCRYDRQNQGTMRINTGEDNDRWHCLKCNKSGDSRALYMKFAYYKSRKRDDWVRWLKESTRFNPTLELYCHTRDEGLDVGQQ